MGNMICNDCGQEAEEDCIFNCDICDKWSCEDCYEVVWDDTTNKSIGICDTCLKELSGSEVGL